MLRLVIVDHQAGVNHSRDPPQEREQQAEDETQNAAGHQHRDRRQHNAEKITQRFQFSYEQTYLRKEREQRVIAKASIHLARLIRFLFTMKKNLITLMFLGLVAIFLGGCTTTTETTTTTARPREQSSMYAR